MVLEFMIDFSLKFATFVDEYLVSCLLGVATVVISSAVERMEKYRYPGGAL